MVASLDQPIDDKLREGLHHAIVKRTWPQEIVALDRAFARTCMLAVENLLSRASVQAGQVCAIGSHGQTIFHHPNGTPPVSIQIGDAAQIAQQTGITTVGNFRQADIDAGGQGAPLACAYHEIIFRSDKEDRAIINLGGIANVTMLAADRTSAVVGFDVGPANTLSDTWIKKHRGLKFDAHGDWAKSGQVNADLLRVMLADEYFNNSPPKSTGREKFNLAWLEHMLDAYGKWLPAEDVQATLVALTARSIAAAMQTWAPNIARILLGGGGSYNAYLVSQLQRELHGIPIEFSSAHGVSEKYMEAMAFAWLAKQALAGSPGNIPSVTGASREVVLGEIYMSG